MKSATESPSGEKVVHLFNRIAPTYDRLNRLLSLRRDVAWRKTLVDALPSCDGLKVLDLATGTAEVLVTMQRRVTGLSHAVGVDLSEEMLERGRAKIESQGMADTIELQQGDATALAFKDATFDAVTIAFGIRNVSDTKIALSEMLRVLKPGGRALILEFSLPRNTLVRRLYLPFFRHVLPRVGGFLSGDREAYEYLNRSVETYPYGDAFISILTSVGFVNCSCEPLTFGVASLYTGCKAS